MAGYIGSTPVPQGIQEQQSFTATAGQTTFNTLGYTDGNTIRVTLNGVLLEGAGVDYTASNGSDIVLTAAASADDVLTFETFNEFNLINQNLTTPTFTDSATVTSTTTASVSVSGDTTAALSLKNNTHEDTDGGRESTLIFQGEQSGGEISTLAEIEASHDGTADDEKGDLIFRTNDGSDGSSPTEAMRIDSSQNVGIGHTSPTAVLDVRRGDASGKIAEFHQSSGYGFELSSSVSLATLSSGYNQDWAFTTDAGSGAVERMRLRAGGGLTFNGDTAAANALDDYEEGTWTPTSPTVTLTGSPSGHYTKIGRMVVYTCTFTFPSSSSGVQAMVDGLPFSDNGTGAGSFLRYTNHGSYYTVTISGNRLYFYDLGGSATSIASVDPRRFDLIGVLMTA